MAFGLGGAICEVIVGMGNGNLSFGGKQDQEEQCRLNT